MQICNIFTDKEDFFPQGRADFLFAVCETQSSLSEGNTPCAATLDAEFLCNERVFSSHELAHTPAGAPSPAVITRAVHNLTPFSSIEILNLGLSIPPQNAPCHTFSVPMAKSITEGAGIDVRDVFSKGMTYAKSYELRGNYLILAQSSTSTALSAMATALALGFECKDTLPQSSKQTLQKALSLLTPEMTSIERLSIVGDTTLIFYAGFLLEASRRFHVVLAGATEMAVCLLIADKLREDVFMRVKDKNITIATTQWAAKDENADIAHLLSQLSFTPHAIYTRFSFANASLHSLHKYDTDEVEDSVGMGAALGYGVANNLKEDSVLEQIEYLLYKM